MPSVRVQELAGRLKTLNRRYRIGLYAVVLLNLLVVAAYAWGQDGQSVTVEVTNEGRFYEASVDGAQAAYALRPGRAGAGDGAGWSWRRGCRACRSRAASTRSRCATRRRAVCCFGTTSTRCDPDVWEVKSGSFEVRDGVLTARDLTTPNNLVLDNRTWTDATVRDYTVSVTYRNGVGGTIGSHVAPGGGAFYSFELVRDFPTFFDARKDGKQTSYVPEDSVFVQPDGDGTLRSIVFMLTRPYPYVAGALTAALWLVFALSFVPLSNPLPEGEGTRSVKLGRWRIEVGLALLGAGALVLLAFVVTLRLQLHYYGALPHVPDEVAYLFQAKLLAAGHIMVPKPPVTWAFNFYELPFMYERDGLWASFYPFGHPLVLAVANG